MATRVSAAMTTGVVKNSEKTLNTGLSSAEGLVIQTNSSGKIPSQYLSTGVHLGGVTAANLLDDYEEGTHVTAMTCGTSGTITLSGSYNTMNYTKVGRLVTVSGDIRPDSVSSPTGSIFFSLPFAVSSSSRFVTSIVTHGVPKQTNQLGPFFLQAVGGTSTAQVSYNKDNATVGSLTGVVSDDDEFKLTLTYETT
tara:strand:- start:4610 stop:5194 length:585 start_codon:yes stop_codon:yes gene_type:complete